MDVEQQIGQRRRARCDQLHVRDERAEQEEGVLGEARRLALPEHVRAPVAAQQQRRDGVEQLVGDRAARRLEVAEARREPAVEQVAVRGGAPGAALPREPLRGGALHGLAEPGVAAEAEARAEAHDRRLRHPAPRASDSAVWNGASASCSSSQAAMRRSFGESSGSRARISAGTSTGSGTASSIRPSLPARGPGYSAPGRQSRAASAMMPPKSRRWMLRGRAGPLAAAPWSTSPCPRSCPRRTPRARCAGRARGRPRRSGGPPVRCRNRPDR